MIFTVMWLQPLLLLQPLCNCLGYWANPETPNVAYNHEKRDAIAATHLNTRSRMYIK